MAENACFERDVKILTKYRRYLFGSSRIRRRQYET